MTGWIIIGFFAAFGMVSAGMVLASLLFFLRCRGRGGWMLLTEEDDCFARYYEVLSSLGILKCRFLTVSSSDIHHWLEERTIERTGGEGPRQDDRSCEL